MNQSGIDSFVTSMPPEQQTKSKVSTTSLPQSKRDVKAEILVKRSNFLKLFDSDNAEFFESEAPVQLSVREETFFIYNADHTETLATILPKHIGIAKIHNEFNDSKGVTRLGLEAVLHNEEVASSTEIIQFLSVKLDSEEDASTLKRMVSFF